jgi:diguanylate cyclase (GGDEF)-like protein
MEALAALDSAPEQLFDDLVETASLIAGSSMAYISLIDDEREWFKASKGFDLAEVPRETGFGDMVISKPESVLVVGQIAGGSQFTHSPLVTGYSRINFYAGAAIVTAAGFPVGVIAVADHDAGDFTADQQAALQLLARQAAAVFELRRDTDSLAAGLVEERAKAAEYAVWQKTHDALTSLPNRLVLEDRIMELDAEEIATNEPHVVSLLAVELVNYDAVNLALGHEGGDKALCQVAYLLAQCLPSQSLLARIENTTFAALVTDTEASEAAKLAAAIHKTLSVPVTVPNFDSVVVSSVVATATSGPRRGFAPSEILTAGESGIAEAKRLGAGSTFAARWESFALRERIAKLRTKFRSALIEGDVKVVYMPLVRLVDSEVIGYEALARWEDPDFGEVSPSEFVPISETNGFVSELDAFVLDVALCDFAEGRIPGEEISVNISPRGVGPGFADAVREKLEEYDVEPGDLVLEATERAGLSGNPILMASLVSLAAMGVRIALDDFGAGETAIAHLRTMPISRLKLDKTLIEGLEGDESGGGRAVVDAIALMAHSLNVETLAEGIENQEQLNVLRSAGVKSGQGYLFGKPMTLEEIKAKQ